jgi:hypothetical protein
MSFCNVLENSLLNHTFGGTVYTPLTTMYVGLSTANPTDTGSFTGECTGGSYARVAITNNKTTWSTSSAGSLSNAITLTFPTATASWGTVTYFFIATASTAGDVVAYGQLSASKTIDTGDTALFNIGDLTINLN